MNIFHRTCLLMCVFYMRMILLPTGRFCSFLQQENPSHIFAELFNCRWFACASCSFNHQCGIAVWFFLPFNKLIVYFSFEYHFCCSSQLFCWNLLKFSNCQHKSAFSFLPIRPQKKINIFNVKIIKNLLRKNRPFRLIKTAVRVKCIKKSQNECNFDLNHIM